MIKKLLYTHHNIYLYSSIEEGLTEYLTERNISDKNIISIETVINRAGCCEQLLVWYRS
jgi:hypothetical protein